MSPATTRGLLLCAAAACLSSCFDYHYKSPVREEAYVPIYSTDSIGARIVTNLPPRKTASAGKMYVQGSLLFQVDNLAGVHVINYADKSHPVKLGFIKCRGCSEVAYKNGYLVINNLGDLVFVDIRDPLHVKEAARMQNAFAWYVQHFPNDRPPVAGKYFVCPDFTKGDIIGWDLQKNVTGADCSN